ncbi:hypothetical protein C8Q76DRAFT_424451 [Earliella scabrosa]|nr:hypothetical protein C8Q76DRAFT_424451 [Earliella scabrosa]
MDTAAEVLHWDRTLKAQYGEFAGITIIFFDWLLTLDREVEQFWSRKLTPAALLYYTNRYSAIACNIFVILQLHSWWGQNVESCKLILGFEMATCLLTLIAVAIFSVMRVYVVCNRNKWILVLITVVVLIHPLITTFTWAKLSIILLPTPEGIVCGYMPMMDMDTYGKSVTWTRGARASVIFADAMVVIITIVQTRKLHSRLNGMHSKGARLLWVLMNISKVPKRLRDCEAPRRARALASARNRSPTEYDRASDLQSSPFGHYRSRHLVCARRRLQAGRGRGCDLSAKGQCDTQSKGPADGVRLVPV